MIKGYITIDKDICKGCELCIEACPQGSLSLSQNINVRGYRYIELNGDSCTGCVNCSLVCPDVAITVYREPKPKKAV